MTQPSRETKTPSQFRLPPWAVAFIEERATATGATKTDVVLEAIESLRQREAEQLMAAGYREMAEVVVTSSDDAVALAAETWPEW